VNKEAQTWVIKMKYLSAYLLCVLAGNESPSFENIQTVLSSAGLDVDADSAHLVVNALKGKNLEELIAAGQKKLASAPCASGTAVVSATAEVDHAKPAAEAPAVDKKPEKEESDDDDMGFGLFD